jgi:hypothetical protein
MFGMGLNCRCKVQRVQRVSAVSAVISSLVQRVHSVCRERVQQVQ